MEKLSVKFAKLEEKIENAKAKVEQKKNKTGQKIGLEDLLESVEYILDGRCDDIDEQRFLYIGSVSEILDRSM